MRHKVFSTIRIILGSIYILSGLIKLNDPWGTAFKLEEYFQLFAQEFSKGFSFFIPHCLSISVLISALEVILGVALILRWRPRITLSAATLLIVFFTLLTWYAWGSGKMKECGCFGDMIKLTAFTSFLKDLFLLVLTLSLWADVKVLNEGWRKDIYILATTLFAFSFGGHAIAHLPYYDPLPFKTGNNIPTLLKPEEAPRFVYIVRKGEEVKEVVSYPTDTTWKLDSLYISNPEKAYPKILDYSMIDAEGNNWADSTLKGKVLLVIIRNVSVVSAYSNVEDQMKKVWTLTNAAEKDGFKVWALTTSPLDELEDFRHSKRLTAAPLNADETMLRMMLRAQCGIIWLENGKVKGKWHYNDIPEITEIKNQ